MLVRSSPERKLKALPKEEEEEEKKKHEALFFFFFNEAINSIQCARHGLLSNRTHSRATQWSENAATGM